MPEKENELGRSLETRILELVELSRVVILEADELKYLIEYDGQQEVVLKGDKSFVNMASKVITIDQKTAPEFN